MLVLAAELWLRGRDFFKRWLVIVILTIIVYVHIRLSFWNLNWVRRVLILLAWARRFVCKWIIMNLLWLLVCKRIVRNWRFEMCFDWWSTGGTSSIGTSLISIVFFLRWIISGQVWLVDDEVVRLFWFWLCFVFTHSKSLAPLCWLVVVAAIIIVVDSCRVWLAIKCVIDVDDLFFHASEWIMDCFHCWYQMIDW